MIDITMSDDYRTFLDAEFPNLNDDVNEWYKEVYDKRFKNRKPE